MLSGPSEWYTIPEDLVPLGYRRMYLAVARCPCDGLCWCRARIDVITARSGRVVWLSHSRDPIIDCNCILMLSRRVRVISECGIESMEWPDWKGDFLKLKVSLLRHASWIRRS